MNCYFWILFPCRVTILAFSISASLFPYTVCSQFAGTLTFSSLVTLHFFSSPNVAIFLKQIKALQVNSLVCLWCTGVSLNQLWICESNNLFLFKFFLNIDLFAFKPCTIWSLSLYHYINFYLIFLQLLHSSVIFI